MIEIRDNFFHLYTNNTSYVFSYTDSGLLVHNFYGKRTNFQSFNAITQKLHGGFGTAILYENRNFEYMDKLDLEFSFNGCGDYRETMLTLFQKELGYVNNFKYQGYEIILDDYSKPVPSSYGENDILRVDLIDDILKVKVELYYKVFNETNIISRYVKIINQSSECLELTKIYSMQLDLPEDDYLMVTLDGAWAKERHIHEKAINQGILVNDSKTGVSSNTHNPAFILKKANTTQNSGECYGFNLVYSGNHCEVVENTITHKIRALVGINSYCLKKILKSNETFISPEAIMTYAFEGLNSMSLNMHAFVNNHIVRGKYQHKIRPIVINNWEATYFKFNEKKLLEIAKQAKALGIEMFVLDDGWFSTRNNDLSGLGDYNVNYKKLPNGLAGICHKINALGLDFGLWVEPEMINENSNLFRNHPEYAVRVPGRTPSLGRNQLLLDLTNVNVQNYLIDNLSNTFSSCNLKYVKWDFNRPITDMYGFTLENQGEFYLKYMEGLYHVLDTITNKFPDILFEGCASGGNRFDLGMLCYFPQIWTSDDTDYVERVFIQSGTSYFYPQSTISNHVSAVPNHQLLRNTPLESRFNLACFGVLGYELDITELGSDELKLLKKEIALYKEYRHTFQFGQFYRSEQTFMNGDNTSFYVQNSLKSECLLGFFQNQIHPSMKEDIIKIRGLDYSKTYYFRNVMQRNNLRQFGGLVNLVLPIRLKIDGKIHKLLCKLYRPSSEIEAYALNGMELENSGIRLHQQFMGTGFNNKVRVLGDYGSRLYIITTKRPDKFYKLLKKGMEF